MGIIRTGIYGYFTAATTSALYSDLSGTRLYYHEAPEQPTIPYCVFHVFNEDYMFTFDLEFEEAFIQFDYYGSSADECDDGIVDIKTLYDYSTISITGYTCLKFERENVFDPVKILPHNIWQGIVRYTLLMKKS